jgi:hypothetical protein
LVEDILLQGNHFNNIDSIVTYKITEEVTAVLCICIRGHATNDYGTKNKLKADYAISNITI